MGEGHVDCNWMERDLSIVIDWMRNLSTVIGWEMDLSILNELEGTFRL